MDLYGLMEKYGPLSPIGSLVNILFCGALLVAGILGLIEGSVPPDLVVAAAALEVVFIVIHVVVRRRVPRDGGQT